MATPGAGTIGGGVNSKRKEQIVKRFLVTTLVLLLTVSLTWAQQQDRQQDRYQQDRYQQQDRMQGKMSPKARAYGYGYGTNGGAECPCPMCGRTGRGMGMRGGMDGWGQGYGQEQGYGQTGGFHGGGRMGMMNFLDPLGFNTSLVMIYHSDMLNLSDQQVRELENIYVQNERERIDIWADLAKARLELHRLTMDDRAPEQQVSQAIDRVANTMADYLSMQYRQKQDVYSVLSPEQRQNFEEFREMQFGQMDQMNGMGRMNGQMERYHRDGQDQQKRKSQSESSR